MVDDGLLAPLDGRELKVYLVLRRSANRDRVAFATQVYIAQLLRCSTRTVRRAVAGLRRKGYVEARQPFIKSPNRYYLVPVQKIGGPAVGHQDDCEKGGQD